MAAYRQKRGGAAIATAASQYVVRKYYMLKANPVFLTTFSVIRTDSNLQRTLFLDISGPIAAWQIVKKII